MCKCLQQKLFSYLTQHSFIIHISSAIIEIVNYMYCYEPQAPAKPPHQNLLNRYHFSKLHFLLNIPTSFDDDAQFQLHYTRFLNRTESLVGHW